MKVRDRSPEEEEAATAARAAEPPRPQPLSPAGVMALQQSAGNQAVGRMLGRVVDAAVDEEVETARRHLESLESGTMITLDEWVLMKRALPAAEYLQALRAFNDWTGPPDVKEKFL